MGKNNWIGPYCYIKGPVQIGDNNRFEAFCAIGTPAEFKGRMSAGTVVIGNRNKINEFVTIHSALEGEEATVIGDDCYIMTKAHIGHDAVLQDHVTLSSASIVGGHSWVMKGANIGLGAAIHQKRVVGHYTMVGMGSVVIRHLPPFVIAKGVPAKWDRVNSVGLERSSFTQAQIKEVCEHVLRSGEIGDSKLKKVIEEFTKATESFER